MIVLWRHSTVVHAKSFPVSSTQQRPIQSNTVDNTMKLQTVEWGQGAFKAASQLEALGVTHFVLPDVCWAKQLCRQEFFQFESSSKAKKIQTIALENHTPTTWMDSWYVEAKRRARIALLWNFLVLHRQLNRQRPHPCLPKKFGAWSTPTRINSLVLWTWCQVDGRSWSRRDPASALLACHRDDGFVFGRHSIFFDHSRGGPSKKHASSQEQPQLQQDQVFQTYLSFFKNASLDLSAVAWAQSQMDLLKSELDIDNIHFTPKNDTKILMELLNKNQNHPI